MSKGTTSVAVEVHQNSATSSDIVFGLVLGACVAEQAGKGQKWTIRLSPLPNGEGVRQLLSWTAGAEWKLYEAEDPDGPWNRNPVSQTSPLVIPKATVESKGKKFYKLPSNSKSAE